MTTIIETNWTDAPRSEQRLNPRSPLAEEVLHVGIPPRVCCIGELTLGDVHVFRLEPIVEPNAFEQARNLALRGDRFKARRHPAPLAYGI